MPSSPSFFAPYVLAALVLASQHTVSAAPVFIDSSLSMNYFIDNQNGASGDDDYTMFIERLRLRSSADGVSAGTRIDTAYFDGNAGPRRSEIRFERLFATIEREEFKLVVGDFYKQLGKGLLLALRKVDEVGFDVVLRGVDGTLEVGDISISVFGGRTNSVNMDNLNFKFVEDPEDIIVGGEVKAQFGSSSLGIHGVHRRNEQNLSTSQSPDASNTLSSSMATRLLQGRVSLSIEGAFQQTRIADKLSDGNALYGTLDFVFGDLAINLESLRLSDFSQNGSRRQIRGQAGESIRYNQPPTLERIDQETSKGIDEHGGRLMVQYSLFDGSLTLTGNALFKQEFPQKAGELSTMHTYGGLEHTYDLERSRFAASGGYRDLRRTGGASNDSFKRMKHSEATWLQHLTGRTSIRLVSLMEFRTLEGEHYVRGSNFIGLETGGIGSLTFEYGIDNQRKQEGIRNHFFAGIGSLNLGRSLTLKSTIGTQRGGLKCVAGICRDYPSFAGARADVIFTRYF